MVRVSCIPLLLALCSLMKPLISLAISPIFTGETKIQCVYGYGWSWVMILGTIQPREGYRTMSRERTQERENDNDKRDGRTKLLIVLMLTTSRPNVSIDTLSTNRPSNAYVDIGSFTNHSSSTKLPSYSSPVPQTTVTNAMNDSAPKSWGMRCRTVEVQCMHG